MNDWNWWAFFAAFAATLLVSTAARWVAGRGVRKAQENATAEEWTRANRPRGTWTQVGALEFRKYGRAVGGARWELEAVVFEDTPGGRLAAKDFQKVHNVQGPTVLHTRDTGRR